jgi:hypothetical protein
MFSGRVRVTAVAGISYLAVLVASCSSPKPTAPPVGRTEMKAVVSVKELMRFTIDPIADNIFDASLTTSPGRGPNLPKPTRTGRK